MAAETREMTPDQINGPARPPVKMKSSTPTRKSITTFIIRCPFRRRLVRAKNETPIFQDTARPNTMITGKLKLFVVAKRIEIANNDSQRSEMAHQSATNGKSDSWIDCLIFLWTLQNG